MEAWSAINISQIIIVFGTAWTEYKVGCIKYWKPSLLDCIFLILPILHTCTTTIWLFDPGCYFTSLPKDKFTNLIA